MLENLARIEQRFDELTAGMASPEVATDYTRLAQYGQERAELEPTVLAYQEYKKILDDIEQANELLAEDDDELV